MIRIIPSAILYLLSLPVFAAAEETTAASAPVETVSMVYVVIFGIVFIGMIAGFFAYMVWGGKDEPGEKK
jgi:ammonia channel protein AmtB